MRVARPEVAWQLPSSSLVLMYNCCACVYLVLALYDSLSAILWHTDTMFCLITHNFLDPKI